MSSDPLLARIVPVLADVPGVAAVVLGGSRARGTAHAGSDYDIGLYYSDAAPLEVDRLRDAVKNLIDQPNDGAATDIGDWGPWIVGGAWLKVGGRKVDLLYRSIDKVAATIDACRAGDVTMHYQPGHPHGFCSAIWMGETALCQPLHDPAGIIAGLKAKTSPYPQALRDALIRRFQWEVMFGIENAELAVARGDATHFAGCAYRALACIGQVLFAINVRYLINEKGALTEAAGFAVTIDGLAARVAEVWRQVGIERYDGALSKLRSLERELRDATTRLQH